MSVPYYPQITITPNLGMSLVGMDTVIAQDFILIDKAFGNVGGSIKVNGSVVAQPNLNNSTPSAPSGSFNIAWQTDGSGNISACVPSLIKFSNDYSLTFPSPSVAQKTPTLQYVTLSSAAGNTVGVNNNVFSGVFNNAFQVGEVISFNGFTVAAAALNGKTATVTGVTAPSVATITNLSRSGNVFTITCANTFNTRPNEVIKLSGLTHNTYLNGHSVVPGSVSGTQFTFTLNYPQAAVNGAETGTATEQQNTGLTASISGVSNFSPITNNGNIGITTQPFFWLYDTYNQKWMDYAYIDSAPVAPPDPAQGVGRLAFARPVRFNDSGSTFNGIIQAGPISLYHVPGQGGDFVGANYFDVSFGLVTQNLTTDTNTYANQHQIYMENRVRGNPSYVPASGETAVTGVRAVLDDQHQNQIPNGQVLAGLCGVYDCSQGISTTPYQGSGVFLCGVEGDANNFASTGTNLGNAFFCGVRGVSTDNSGGQASSGLGIGGYFKSVNFSGGNFGIYVPAHTASNSWDAMFENNGANTGLVGICGHLIMGGDNPGHTAIRLQKSGGTAPSNTDLAGVLSFSAATAVSYTFTETYNASNPPIVVITPVNPGTTTFTITALSNTGFTVTASVAFTGSVNYICIGRN